MWIAEKRSIELLRFRSDEAVAAANTDDAPDATPDTAILPPGAAAHTGGPSDPATAHSPNRKRSLESATADAGASGPSTTVRPRISVKLNKDQGPSSSSRAFSQGFSTPGGRPGGRRRWPSFLRPATSAAMEVEEQAGDGHEDNAASAALSPPPPPPPSRPPGHVEEDDLTNMLQNSGLAVDERNTRTVPGEDRGAPSPTSFF